MRRMDGHDALVWFGRIGLAALLFAAAGLKVWSIAHGDAAVPPALWSVPCEGALGLWLVSGRRPALAMACAGLVFMAFFGFHIAAGERIAGGCGCFGSLRPSRGWMLLITGTAAAAGVAGMAAQGNLKLKRARLALFGASLPACALFGALVARVGFFPAAWTGRADVGTGAGGSAGTNGYILIHPRAWVGKKFPHWSVMFPPVENRDAIHLIVFYHADCSDCQELLNRLRGQLRGARNDGAPNASGVLLVRVPDGSGAAHGSAVRALRAGGIRLATLPRRPAWLIQTPVAAVLSDRRVVRIVRGPTKIYRVMARDAPRPEAFPF